MATPRYEDIRRRSTEIYDMNRGIFLTETHLYGRMAELLLSPLEDTPPKWTPAAKWVDDVKTALQLVIARMFDDFEAAQSLILHGLCEQAYMPMRDSIECMMLTRLFRLDAKKAQDWVLQLKHYQADQIGEWIKRLGEDPFEYNFYAIFSQRSHANLMGSLYRVEETTRSNGSIESRTINFGAYPNHVVTATVFKLLLTIMYWSIAVVLPPLYVPFMDDADEWQNNVRALRPELEKLDPKLWQPLSVSPSDDDALSKWQAEVIRRRLGLNRLEKLVSDLEKREGDAPEVR